jgi:hypothetical protein
VTGRARGASDAALRDAEGRPGAGPDRHDVLGGALAVALAADTVEARPDAELDGRLADGVPVDSDPRPARGVDGEDAVPAGGGRDGEGVELVDDLGRAGMAGAIG